MGSYQNLIQSVCQDRDYRFDVYYQIDDTSEFARLLRKSGIKRLIYGLEYLHEYRDYDNIKSFQRNNQLKFFCELCHLKLDVKNYECVEHFASYVHLFRYTKVKYPAEYRRLLTASNDDVDVAISTINLLLKTLNSRLLHKMSHKIHIYDSNNFYNDYYLSIENAMDVIDLDLVKYGLDYKSLVLRNQTDHNLDLQNSHETLLANLKMSPHTNSFLDTLCNDDFMVDNTVSKSVNSHTSHKKDKRIKSSESSESIARRHHKRPCLDNENNQLPKQHQNDNQEVNMNNQEDESLILLVSKANDIANDKLQVDHEFIDELKENLTKIDLEDDVYNKLRIKMALFLNNQEKASVKEEPIDLY